MAGDKVEGILLGVGLPLGVGLFFFNSLYSFAVITNHIHKNVKIFPKIFYLY